MSKKKLKTGNATTDQCNQIDDIDIRNIVMAVVRTASEIPEFNIQHYVKGGRGDFVLAKYVRNKFMRQTATYNKNDDFVVKTFNENMGAKETKQSIKKVFDRKGTINVGTPEAGSLFCVTIFQGLFDKGCVLKWSDLKKILGNCLKGVSRPKFNDLIEETYNSFLTEMHHTVFFLDAARADFIIDFRELRLGVPIVARRVGKGKVEKREKRWERGRNERPAGRAGTISPTNGFRSSGWREPRTRDENAERL